MRSVQGRLLGISAALAVVITALFHAAGAPVTGAPAAGALSSPEYVPMPPGDFYVYRSDHFDIYYDSSRITYVDDAVMGAEGAYNTVTGFFGPYNHRIRVILAANHQQYANLLYDYLSGKNISEDEVASGWSYGERATIVIEAPDQAPGFEAAMAHELTHIAMRTRLTDNRYSVPEWFSEGLAIHVSGEKSPARAAVEEACRDGNVMTVAQMEEVLQRYAGQAADVNGASMARAQAGMLMEYIAVNYGNDTIKRVIEDFDAAGDMEEAFLERIGYSPEAINAEWKVNLKGRLAASDGLGLAQQVYGHVLYTGGKPVANEIIAFTYVGNDSSEFGKTYTATTDNAGFYKLNLTYGLFSVQLDRPGYEDVKDSITLQKGEVRPYDVTLVEAPAPTQNARAVPQVAGGQAVYIVLGILNAAAIILIAFMFWRTKK